MIALSLLLAAAAPAAGCATVPLIATERRADVVAIRRRPGQVVAPREISAVMVAGRWKAVWATPADAERGVYFVRRDAKRGWRLVEVWGGVIAPDERAETVAWARKLGPDLPPQLANCFADALLDGK